MKNTIQPIGKMEGTVLVFGGVYSNLESLTALKGLADRRGIPASNIICTGDMPGYCADPEECLLLIRQWGIHCIAGNVEIQLRDGLDDCGCDFEADSRCDLFAKAWYPYARKRTGKASLAWLKTLPEFIGFDFYGRKCLVVHGSYFRTSEFIFRSTPWAVKQRNFDETGADVILAGHCGLPFHHIVQDKYWLNPGVIGMPANDGTPRVWYMLLHPPGAAAAEAEQAATSFRNAVADPAGGRQGNAGLHFSHEYFEYDNEETFARMLEEELPIAYAKTLTSGLWDNNDILPEEETAAQGVPLAF